jgi:two-component system sensor histidine kinase KdpD
VAYLGAAPGSGKTFTMLKEGRALRAQGEDVVIGYADTGGRAHTEEAVGGLEIVPPRLAERDDHGEAAPEMDLAAVLDRRPSVALVDDLVLHASAIEALRSAGVHVISTADVADFDRTAAEVSAITGQPAPGGVSDEVLDGVDALQFVDSSPEALRKRLSHGNIYPADQIDAAMATTFQPARLAALREIGLRLVAQSVPAPGADWQRDPQDVLVAVWRTEQVDALVQRGVRLARRRGAGCCVLALSPHGPAATALTDRVAAAATAGGASVVVRDSRDAAAALISAVQELRARHLVLAVPSAGLLERWRGSLLERLAGQLPGVHLHIQAAGSGLEQDVTEGNEAGTAGGPAPVRRRGAIRVYLGYAPGCGTTTAMLAEAIRRQARGADVVIGAVDAGDREDVVADTEQLELVGDGGTLDTAAVLARRPEVVCIDDLTAGTTSAERRFAAARRLADAGITVVGTVQLGRLGGQPEGGPAAFLDEPALLALADEIELVDVPPSILIDRVRRGEIWPASRIEPALATIYDPDALRAARERAFRLVAEHGERRLAAYEGDDQGYRPGPAEQERWPSILACAAPWPGMEPLIRRSAALAAQVDGIFRAGAVRLSQPGTEEDELLAGYAALTEQLGGEFVVLAGTSAAAALAEYASQREVTELVLTRAQPNPAGRYPVLRELARLARDVELHVLPVE